MRLHGRGLLEALGAARGAGPACASRLPLVGRWLAYARHNLEAAAKLVRPPRALRGARVILVNNRVEIAMLDEDHPEVEFAPSAAQQRPDNPKGLPSISELLELGCSWRREQRSASSIPTWSFAVIAMSWTPSLQPGERAVSFGNRYERQVSPAEPSLPYLTAMTCLS